MCCVCCCCTFNQPYTNDRCLDHQQHQQIIATGRRGERLSALQRELGGGSRVHTVQSDVADIEAMRAAMEESSLPPAFRTVDVLVRVHVCVCIRDAGSTRSQRHANDNDDFEH